MKTAAKRARTAPAKTVDDYFSRVPEPAREMLTKLRATIRSVVPATATETISYGIPAFRDNKIIVWYAAFASHCSLFPTGATIEACKDDLKGFTISKGTVQFPLDKPLPIALIKKLVKARLAALK
jgi:uncharacterized protein YdhG (YjbR/CyaY superfamily)